MTATEPSTSDTSWDDGAENYIEGRTEPRASDDTSTSN